jgi:uncharacterized membrane protein YczE
VHEPPALRGGVAVRLGSLALGLFVFACGIVGLLEARLGLAPWDVLHQGIAHHSPLSFGVASIAVGIVVLAVAWLLGAKVGLGTVANATVVGACIQLLTSLDAVADLSSEPLLVRIAIFAVGMVCFGVGSALYIGAAMGAGPRDSLMLVLSRRSRVRIGIARATVELAALASGFALGGKVGVGTLAFALLIGPAVELSFWLLDHSPLVLRPANLHLAEAVEISAR